MYAGFMSVCIGQNFLSHTAKQELKQLAKHLINNTMKQYHETRVYVIKVDGMGSDDYTDEEFMTLAEEQGTVYTLKGFQYAFNYEEVIDLEHYIRII